MGDPQKFWAKDPCVLFTDLRIFPTAAMTKNEKLNAVTRLAFVITLLLYLYDYDHWCTFLALSLLVVLLVSIGGEKTDKDATPEEAKEGFTATPNYLSQDMQQTSVAPTFSEEWQLYPPTYDIYDSVPAPVTFEEPISPQAYPYGQVLSTTNLLPSDEFYVRQMGGSTREAREFANDNWTRQTLAFRDNMTRIMKDRLARRFRMESQDTFSPYNSY